MIQLPEKTAVHEYCLQLVRERIEGLELQLADLTESAANETKSTAGDKYETARAMLHIEQDQVRRQMRENRSILATLEAIDPLRSNQRIGPGSLACLNGDWYYFGASLGRQDIGGMQIIAVSMLAPLSGKLKGLGIGETASVNGRSYQVEALR